MNGTPKSSRMSPITCITASVRPDGLGVCSSASSVSIIHVRSASAMAAVSPTLSPLESSGIAYNLPCGRPRSLCPA
ncbi:hypothetical protein I548_5501 [Mycobacterium intracellulare]|nr:hypothetical protein I548_5501 [Mycobacterium intracellulare]